MCFFYTPKTINTKNIKMADDVIIYKIFSEEKPPLGKHVMVKRSDGTQRQCYLEIAYIDNATFETIYLWKFVTVYDWEWAWYTNDDDEWI